MVFLSVFEIVVLIVLFHFIAFAIPPLVGSFLDHDVQIYLNYTYLGVLFTLVQLFDSLYSIKLTDNILLNGGDIAYSALLFSTIYLISTQPEPKVVRNLFYIFIINIGFLFLITTLIRQSLSTGLIIDHLHIGKVFLEFSILSLLLSLLLYVGEILFIIITIKRLSDIFTSQNSFVAILTFAYVSALFIDGILYPVGTNFLFGTNLSVINGIIAKLVFSLGFGSILIILLVFKPKNFSEFITNKAPIIAYLLPPRSFELKQKLAEAEEQIEELKEILPICAQCKKIRDDKGYWEQLEAFLSKNKDITFSHGLCPDCLKKNLELIEKGKI